ncbi:ALK and LTK ligand 2 Protein FAM150B Precursor [Larimichthys crocea]|uniref:ALK and LTK ligand 2 Protein FAM150B n=1 Tax=Larimichthys crocea TaxID=215358 RepID=A0A6G0I5Z3_LARCR|nr:ALK and LTK ligand 2 Protein FAM150B Precursor [Larimichthys crocea]
MNGLRRHFNMGLVLLMCTLTGHSSDSAPSPAPNAAATGRDAQQGTRRIVEIVKHVEDSRVRHSTKTKTPFTTQERIAPVEPKDLRNLKTDRGDPAVGDVMDSFSLCLMAAIKLNQTTFSLSTAVFPRVPSKKLDFLKYLTGPLVFSPKCRKHVYRLYHHTRDCTIPAYFKRCARLLTRLAGSPQCTEG